MWRFNIYLIEVVDGENRWNGGKVIFEKKMVEDFFRNKKKNIEFLDL